MDRLLLVVSGILSFAAETNLMVTTQFIPQPKSKEVQAILPGIQWQTFQRLTQEISPNCGYQIVYDQQTHELRFSHSDQGEINRIFSLSPMSWQTYRALITNVGDDRGWRIAFADGVLEIRMPLEEHEEPKELLVDFIIAIVDELEIEVRKLGSLLLEREDLQRAIEPDACFYIQHELAVRGKKINLQTDPPPDLAIESDYTNSSLSKHSIYAALGVPELWRYCQDKLEVYILQQNAYILSSTSLAFPFLPIAEIPDFIERSQEIGQRAAVRLFRERIRGLRTSGE
jgi:Uma2 family endonuclease